jgi:hypothetical protein
MSTELIEQEIRRFLSSDEPEVVCLSGHWGVGKTYAWNKYLRDASGEGKIALKRYSYVSLFGVNSLDDFKYSVFESTVQCSEIAGMGAEPTLDTLRTNIAAATERIGRKTTWFLQQLPWVRNHIGGLGPTWFLLVKNTLICVDDIERRGKGLSVRDVLGLITHLTERKKCKVILILNDEDFQENETDFQTYHEKVIDVSLKFAPTPEECARIALSSSTVASKLLGDSCVTLGISNIRIIKKIERRVRRIEPLLKGLEEQVLTQAVKSLALLGWSNYEPKKAPSLDYLRKRGETRFTRMDKQTEVSDQEAAWNALLDAYGFDAMDEFDLALLDGVHDGFFDEVRIRECALELHRKLEAHKRDQSFVKAWGLYHDSFAQNEGEVVDAIHQACLKNIESISPIDLDATVKLLKALDRSEFAADVIGRYVASSAKNRKAFDLRTHPFGHMITDPDVVRAFETKTAETKDERNPAEILLSMATTRGWTAEDMTLLSTLPVQAYRDIFKGAEGSNLHLIIDACLQFDRIEDATEPMKDVSRRAKEALRIIGQESRINAVRVMKYGRHS